MQILSEASNTNTQQGFFSTYPNPVYWISEIKKSIQELYQNELPKGQK